MHSGAADELAGPHGKIGRGFRHGPRAGRGARVEPRKEIEHRDFVVLKWAISMCFPASRTTTEMPFCASSLASVPPPAPEPMITTTAESFRSKGAGISVDKRTDRIVCATGRGRE